MAKVSTFCPRCGETIETDVPVAARVAGRAEVDCPACRFSFMIAPARARARGDGVAEAPPETGRTSRSMPPGDTATIVRPETGAPTEPPRPAGFAPVPLDAGQRPRSLKPVAAAFILLFVVVYNVYIGSSMLVQEDIIRELFSTGERTVIEGTVRAADGSPLPNATVTITSAPNATMVNASFTPDAAGAYRIADGVVTGIYVLRFEAPGYVTLDLELPAVPPDLQKYGDFAILGDVTLKEGSGSEERSVLEEVFEPIRIALGSGMLVLAGLSTLGMVAAFFRRALPMAVIGAVAGILALLNPIGALISIVALVLLIMARKEFGPLVQGRPGP